MFSSSKPWLRNSFDKYHVCRCHPNSNSNPPTHIIWGSGLFLRWHNILQGKKPIVALRVENDPYSTTVPAYCSECSYWPGGSQWHNMWPLWRQISQANLTGSVWANSPYPICYVQIRTSSLWRKLHQDHSICLERRSTSLQKMHGSFITWSLISKFHLPSCISTTSICRCPFGKICQNSTPIFTFHPSVVRHNHDIISRLYSVLNHTNHIFSQWLIRPNLWTLQPPSHWNALVVPKISSWIK